MNTKRSMAFASLLAFSLALSLALSQSGCKGCDDAPAPPVPSTSKQEVPAPTPEVAKVAPVKAAPEPEPEPYVGPQSRSRDGYKLTSGFADAKGDSVTQPTALEVNTFYVTALDPDNRPLGALKKFAKADVHAFLVARDMRQALYTKADKPVAEGADARAVNFTPREGGDYALIVVLAPDGLEGPRTISTPVVIKGALPEVMGPGVKQLTARSRTKGGDVELRADKPLVAGVSVGLSTVDLDNVGHEKGTVKLPFVVIYNEEMGFGDVLTFDDKGRSTWRPPHAGRYLVLAPPEEGDGALTFKLEVAEPPKDAPVGAPASPRPAPASPQPAPAPAPKP